MPPSSYRGGLDGFSSADTDTGQPSFGLLGERRGWRGVLVECGSVVYTLLLDVITKPLTRDCFCRTNAERNGAALSLGARHVYPVATVAWSFGRPRLAGLCWLIHVS